jgi:cold shock CspA family protein
MTVKTDFSTIDDDIEDEISKVVEYSQSRGDKSYTEDLGRKDITMWQREAREAYGKLERLVEDAISSLPNWGGSDVVLKPQYSGGPIAWESDEPHIKVDVYLHVYKGGGWQNAPSFMVMTEDDRITGIDDTLDAGDTDFFNDPAIEADYFMLAEEIRTPGGAKRLGNKVVTLYTARPAKDRAIYNHAKQIPVNVFLTTSEDEAYGYIADSGGGRDVFQVRIKRMYLVETLNAGSKKNYQTFSGSGRTVPVESCVMVFEDQKIARRVVTRWLKGP